MRLVLLGAPGCGKGTHSEWLMKDLGIPQISTGDILRDSVANGTELGKKAKGFMDSGSLVPDEVILGLMAERLKGSDAGGGFILDGFPRTIPQAEGLDKILADHKLNMDRVIKIDVASEELVRRLTQRRVCPACKAVYNLDFRPPKTDGVCDTCGGKIIQRDDDTEETVDQTAPLIAYYQDKGLLTAINGNGGFDEAREQIREALGLQG
ncbi:adenylate kinase [Candidatus Eisenbacteria bacterium]|uniref:Adenylate kinase n=1 Tax=Eiseniibacteriota bacterium TaxID=2212470 RepID=A0ABV6YKW0_UNCEI